MFDDFEKYEVIILLLRYTLYCTFCFRFQMFVQKASVVLKTVTEHTLSKCADMLLDVLVRAY